MKGDFFGEVLHSFRRDVRDGDYVKLHMHLHGSDDMRDHKAIARLTSAYLKLLFPNLQLTDAEFQEFCLRPAVELRQRVRDELHRLDSEYAAVKIEIG